MTQATGEMKIWILRLFAGSWATMAALASLLLRSLLPDFELWWLPLAAALFFASGLVVPAMMLRPYRLVERFLKPVGRVFAYLMLALVFYGVFAPFALILRLVGWDPLRRRQSSWGASAWVEQDKTTDHADYRWQY